MKRKLLSAILCTTMVATLLVGCGSTATESKEAAPAATEEAAPATEEAAPATEEAAPAATDKGGITVGVAMPTKDLQRWNQDGENMQKQLEEDGYKVDLQYASNDVATQVSQIENMISSGDQILVIASIDGSALGSVLDQAKAANIPVIAYDRLIMNTDAVSYYCSFDNYKVGVTQGQYVVDSLDLDNAAGPFNVEFCAGDPADNNALLFYNGAMDTLKPYIESGKLVVKSGQTEFADVATAAWSTETCQARVQNIISSYYADGTKLDAIVCSNDSTALGACNAIESDYNGDQPIVTGQDCDIANMPNLIAGKQSMSIYKDTRDLAKKCVEMVDALMSGSECEVNDTKTYDNGVMIVPSYLCDVKFADKDNYKELLIDSGYYTEDQLSSAK